MPKVSVSRSRLLQLRDEGQCSVVTPLGTAMLEIQGDLAMEIASDGCDPGDPRVSVLQGQQIFRFGLLDLHGTSREATLYIGQKQRMVGKLVKLDVPMGVLHFDTATQTAQLQDIIRYRLIFRDRPLPIM
ncbi:Ctf8p KNAG_0M00320 [Huiozyma naganishii CBS 8797]|uniref:Chromosome transmission fidelity protein 8 n=1 Tax=Huiozyma naganishii (strain ATCC MYA-139 / BCRC 22969 / CBS 8797 / KCTC 17520 / NBRC 10181 / NCYC 3082 / Yp74L-3) TaxID=1071383 RepID=J7RDC4_HUIN7|nr:hypothetical protein KNAG_0M00320 [Kazachstania naganishii CBS 8797]CCK72885.1 hypothetical protein KNAG_0M00320 [Kazachstania naganishii CBS 8797]